MTDDDRIKEYLNRQITRLEDDQFTKAIVDSHLDKLEKGKKPIIQISSQLVCLAAITLYISGSCFLLYVTGIKEISAYGHVVDRVYLSMLTFVAFIAMAYRYLADLLLTNTTDQRKSF